MVASIFEAKKLLRYISRDCKRKIVQHVIQTKNGIMINATVCVKSAIRAKKIIAGILAHVFVRTVGIWKVFLMIQ